MVTEFIKTLTVNNFIFYFRATICQGEIKTYKKVHFIVFFTPTPNLLIRMLVVYTVKNFSRPY